MRLKPRRAQQTWNAVPCLPLCLGKLDTTFQKMYNLLEKNGTKIKQK